MRYLAACAVFVCLLCQGCQEPKVSQVTIGEPELPPAELVSSLTGETVPQPPTAKVCPPSGCFGCDLACTLNHAYDPTDPTNTGVCPQVADWCGVKCGSDDHIDSPCPPWPLKDGGAIQLQPLFCGGEPPPGACIDAAVPVCQESVQAYCCNPTLKPLPPLAMTKCEKPNGECMASALYDGTCHVSPLAEGTPCSVGACYGGFCRTSSSY